MPARYGAGSGARAARRNRHAMRHDRPEHDRRHGNRAARRAGIYESDVRDIGTQGPGR